MDIKKFEVFLKAAEYGSLTKAAEAMGYTQSGVSHMMKSLEAEVGFPLFQRSSRGISLNDNGEKLLPIVRKLLGWNEELEQAVSSIKGVVSGNISIGTFSSVSVHWLPRIIKDFQTDYPKINIGLLEGGIQEIDQWLADGVVDMGFFSLQPHQSYEWIPLKRDPLVAVMPADYDFPDNTPYPIRDFEGKPFIMSTIGFDYDIHRVLEEHGVEADVKFSSMDDNAILSMVENGLGLSILPELIVTHSTTVVKVARLEPERYRSLGLALPSTKRASPAAKKFIQYTKHVLTRDRLV